MPPLASTGSGVPGSGVLGSGMLGSGMLGSGMLGSGVEEGWISTARWLEERREGKW